MDSAHCSSHYSYRDSYLSLPFAKVFSVHFSTHQYLSGNMHCFLHSASAGTGYELLSAMDTNRYLSSAASVIPVYHDRLPRTQICKAGIYKTISPYRLPSVCISSDQYAFHLSHNHLFCTGICYLLSKCKSSGSGYAHGG